MSRLKELANERLSDIEYHGLFLPYLHWCRVNKDNSFNRFLVSYCKRGELKDALILLAKKLKF